MVYCKKTKKRSTHTEINIVNFPHKGRLGTSQTKRLWTLYKNIRRRRYGFCICIAVVVEARSSVTCSRVVHRNSKSRVLVGDLKLLKLQERNQCRL